MIILVAGLALAAWRLERYKDSKLQPWLGRCVFAKETHHASAELEHKEFASALKKGLEP